MKKGISMPINTVVILAVAVIALVAIIAFFMFGMGQRETLDIQQKISASCNTFATFGCSDAGWELVKGESVTDDKNILEYFGGGDGTDSGLEENAKEAFKSRCGCSLKRKKFLRLHNNTSQ